MRKRKTKSKEAVLDCLEKSKHGLKSDEIVSLLSEFDRVTVYRILQGFVNDGIIHKVISDDGKYYYFKCHSCGEIHYHNHYHFKCTICENVECIGNEVEVNIPKNYTIENINFWITGVCENCNK